MKGEGEGYEQIANAGRAIANGDFAINWHLDGVGLQIIVAGAAGSAVTTGRVSGNPPTDRHPAIITRRHATATAIFRLPTRIARSLALPLSSESVATCRARVGPVASSSPRTGVNGG